MSEMSESTRTAAIQRRTIPVVQRGPSMAPHT